MRLALAHNNMDFDSLAAQYALTRLHPDCQMVLGSQLTGSVRSFVTLNRDLLPVAQIKYVDMSRVTGLFIVDCQQAERLDEQVKSVVAQAVPGGDMRLIKPVTIYDHHPIDPDGLSAGATADSVIESVGAATTLVVEKLIEKKTALTAFDATLLAIGIYEDTGCLTYQGTTSRDADCLAYLLHQGADLTVVQQYIKPRMEQEQLELFEILLNDAMTIELEGQRYVIACHQLPQYVDGLANITRQLLDLESCQGAFTIVGMKDRVHIVGRCEARAVSARELVRRFGGDGHPGAASAVVKNGDVEAIKLELVEFLRQSVIPEPVARDIMATPVRTVRPDISMEEAGRIMVRYDLDGLVVAEHGTPVGIVSRRDIDQSTHHKLGHARVSGFMSHPVIAVELEATLSQMQQLMVDEEIGRLPVLDKDGRLAGLISRQNVLNHLFGSAYSKGARQSPYDMQKPFRTPGGKLKTRFEREGADVVRARFENLPPETVKLSRLVGEAAAASGKTAYAVGGFVRDLLLDLPNYDVDYVIEGSAIELSAELTATPHFSLVATHERFGTATLRYSDGDYNRLVDLSTARTEFYQYPAALPDVEPSRLEQDLLRRDFTINAMALCINPDRFLELVDRFGGLVDLEQKAIRILHPFSFIEDPTRIVRAARFAGRLNFHFESRTWLQAKRALGMGIFDDLGGVRIKQELKSILESGHRLKSLSLLGELDGRLAFIDRQLTWSEDIRRTLRRAERLLERYQVEEEWVVYLGVLLHQLAPERVQSLLERLHLTAKQSDAINSGLALYHHLPLDLSTLPHSRLYRLFAGHSREALAIAAASAASGTYLRRALRLYLEELADTALEISGKDLIELGHEPGPEIGLALGHVLDAVLDRRVKGLDEELALAVSLLVDA